MSSGEGKEEPTGTPPAWSALSRRDSGDWLSWRTLVSQAGRVLMCARVCVNTPIAGERVGFSMRTSSFLPAKEPEHLADLRIFTRRCLQRAIANSGGGVAASVTAKSRRRSTPTALTTPPPPLLVSSGVL